MNDGEIKPKKSKGYLLCDNCGGSYELQEGESPEDFSDKCECGGNLKHTKDLSNTNTSQSRSNEELSSTINEYAEKVKDGSIVDRFIALINFKLLIIGGVLIIILTLGYGAISTAFFMATTGYSQYSAPGPNAAVNLIIVLIISVVAGYLLRKYNTAAIHGGLFGIIGLFMSWGLLWYVGFGFIPIIIGVIGGIAGAVLRKRIKKDEKLDQKVEKVKGKVGDVLNTKNVPNDVKDKLGNVLDSSTKKVPTDKTSSVSDPYEEIKKAKELLDMGALTEEEFSEMKKKILYNT